MNLITKIAAVATAVATTAGFGLSAHAVDVSGTLSTATTIAAGDSLRANIILDVVDGAGTETFDLTVVGDIITVETNDVNDNDGLIDPTVSFFVQSGGVGAFNMISMIDGADLISGAATIVGLSDGDVFRIVAGWAGVAENDTQFTLRVTADAVPLPAAGLFLLTGLAGVAGLRSRKKVA